MSKTPLTTLSVKIDVAMDEALRDKSKRAGTTVSDYVRTLLREALDEESELARLRLQLSALQGEMISMRQDFYRSVEAMLVAVGAEQKISPEQARAWVNQRLRRGEV